MKIMLICLIYLAPSKGLYVIKIRKVTFGVRKNELIWEEGVSHWSTVEVSGSAFLLKFVLAVIIIAGPFYTGLDRDCV